MFNNFFFIGLPYAALVIVLVGSLFRYFRFGFKVSSLSSQFLEGRELFSEAVLFTGGSFSCFLAMPLLFYSPDLSLPGDRCRCALLFWKLRPWDLHSSHYSG